MTQTPTPVTADFCSFDEYKKIEGTQRTIGFCENDATERSEYSASGYVEIEKDGEYTFLVESDDGAELNIGGHSLDKDGPHSLSGRTLKVTLAAGFHRLVVEQYDIGATQREDGSWTRNSNALYLKWGDGSPGGNYKSGDTPGSTPSSWASVPLWEIEKRIEPSLSPSENTLYVNPLENEPTPVSESGVTIEQSQSGEIEIWGEPPEGCYLTSDNSTALILGSIERNNSTSGPYGSASMQAGTLPGDDTEEYSVVVNISLCNSEGATLTGCQVTIQRNKCKEECECKCIECEEGTETDAGCISFGIGFGKSPHLTGAPAGQLKIEEDKPSARIYTPAVLHYNHPMMRKISYVSPDGRRINVQTELGDLITYKDGRPFGNSSGTQSEMHTSRDTDNAVTGYYETLPDRTTIHYTAAGHFSHLVTSENFTATAANMGIDPILDDAGNIRQIWSASEGLLDVTTTGATSFVISWYKNSQITSKDAVNKRYLFTGAPIKTFTFSKPAGTVGNNVLHLTEQRGDTFSFDYEWTYVATNSDWTMRKGSDAVFYSKAKSRTRAANGNVILGYVTTGSDSGGQTTTNELSTTSQGNRIIGRTINGVSQMSGTRDSSVGAGGRLGSTVNRSGNTTSYTYDFMGRITRMEQTGFAGLSQVTKYEYGTNVHSYLDLRPVKITESLANPVTRTSTELAVTEYLYTDDTQVGKTETVKKTVNGVTQETKQNWWPVSNTVSSGRLMSEIRADGTMTFYEYSATDISALNIDNYQNFSYTETITEGIKTNVVADHYFGIVSNRSTRIVNTYNAAGDIVRTENYVHYNGSFRLVSWVEHTYNPMHKIIASTYSNGKTSSADWICTGPVFEIDTDGIRTDYTYDALKRCTSKVRHSPNGDITTTYTYDVDGRILSQTVSGGTGDSFVSETTSQTYDIEGRIATQTDARGLTTSFSYSADNLTTTETRPNGGTVITTRNLDGTIASVTGTAVTPVYYTYTLAAEDGLEITEERYGTPNSKRWKKTYVNQFGQTVKIQESAWNESVKTTVHTYNAKGQLIRTTSTDSPTVTYTYDSMGEVSKEEYSDGETTRIVSHSSAHMGYSSEYAMRKINTTSCSDTTIPGNSTSVITQLSGLSNALEQKTDSKNVRSLSTIDQSSFDPETKIHTHRHTEPGAGAGTTTLVRDGQTLSVTDSVGASMTYTYDALGRQLTATDSRGNTTTNVYNSIGQLVSTTDAASNTTTYAYSATTGELTAVTDANGKTVNYVYDLKGQKVAEYGSAIYPVTYEYDIFGELVRHVTYRNPSAVIDTNPDPATGDQTLWNYDESSGLLVSKTYANGKSVTYNYDVKGQLLSRTWARLNNDQPLVTTYSYSPYGELLNTAYSDGTTPGVSASYNTMGMLVETTDASGVTTCTYTNYRELASESNSILGTVFNITRDNLGRETSSALLQGENSLLTTSTQYNNNQGRITKGVFGSNQFNYTYLSNSHLLDQVTTCGGAAKKVFTYEEHRDLPTEIAFKLSNNTLIAKRNYTYDALGRVATRTQTRGTDTARNDAFGYNDRSELTSATIGTDGYSYSYDNIGNRITARELADEINYSSNNLNQYTGIVKNEETPFVPTFDDDGNQLTVQTATGIWNVSYNAENRPVTFTNGTTVVECKYDSQGRRFEKKVTEDGSIVFWQRYAYKGYLQIAAFNVTTETVEEVETEIHTIATTTYWDPTEETATRPLAFMDHTVETPATYFYTHDLTKNVCEVLSRDGSVVTVVTTYDYTPFGAVTASNAATPNTFMFSSEVCDTETALVYYNFRHYNPADGRWISRDPIGENGGWNVYGYVNNSFCIEVDYNGNEGIILFSCAIVLLLAAVGCDESTGQKVNMEIEPMDLKRTLDTYNYVNDAVDTIDIILEDDPVDQRLKSVEKVTEGVWPEPINPARILRENIFPGIGKPRMKK